MNIYDKGILFKGYVKTKDKKCLEKLMDRTDFKTFDHVKKLPEFAGVIDDHIALIDIDDFEQSEILFNIIQGENISCVVIKTGRGKHFYFKNDKLTVNKTKTSLAIGVESDIKLGIKNSYGVVKTDGNLREVLHCPEQIDSVPFWMQPIKTKPDFANLEEGDGRNQTLYNYILTLQNQGMTTEEIRQTIRIINKYVLKEPLSEQEIEVILRDEAFKKQSFFQGSKFLHDRFAAYLKSNYHIIRNDGAILIYKDGVYEYSIRSIEKAMVDEIPTLKDAQRKEVIKHLNLICDDAESSSPNLIAFRNGVLNITTQEVMPFSPGQFITNKINWDYNPNAYSELADKTLDKIACGDAEIRAILEEIIGACFYRSNTLAGGKAFILTGEGSNGKSTFIAVLNRLLGNDNISALDMKNLDNKFSTVRMYKKLANIGDDISEEFNSDVSTFKKVVTGDRIEAEEKGQPKFEFNPYCKLIFSANSLPRIKDSTGAAQRRLLIVPFNARFTAEDPDYDTQIVWKLQRQDAIEYFILVGIQGLKRVLENQKFTSSVKVQKEIEDYAEMNNPILAFIEEVGADAIENEPTNDVYLNYCAFCRVSGFKEMTRTSFTRQLKRYAGFEVTYAHPNGKTIRVYSKK